MNWRLIFFASLDSNPTFVLLTSSFRLLSFNLEFEWMYLNVSSTNRLTRAYRLNNKINRIAPRTDPCGTPRSFCSRCDVFPFTLVCCLDIFHVSFKPLDNFWMWNRTPFSSLTTFYDQSFQMPALNAEIRPQWSHHFPIFLSTLLEPGSVLSHMSDAPYIQIYTLIADRFLLCKIWCLTTDSMSFSSVWSMLIGRKSLSIRSIGSFDSMKNQFLVCFKMLLQ